MFETDCRNLLLILDDSKQYKTNPHWQPFEVKTKRFSGWYSWLAVLYLAVGAALVFFHAFLTFDIPVIVIGVYSFAGALFTLISFFPVIVLFFLYAKNWKKVTFSDLDSSLKHDYRIVSEIQHYPTNVLSYTKSFIEIKTARLERRINFLFGSTAMLPLFFLLIAFSDRYDVFDIFLEIFNKGITTKNYLQWGIVYFTVFVMALALGALPMKNLTSRYSYQAELIALALEAKKAQSPVSDSNACGT